jgi:hypothetical protein
MARLWREAIGDGGGRAGIAHPGLFLIYDRHVIDLSSVETLEQAQALAAAELDGSGNDVPVLLVALPPRHAT